MEILVVAWVGRKSGEWPHTHFLCIRFNIFAGSSSLFRYGFWNFLLHNRYYSSYLISTQLFSLNRVGLIKLSQIFSFKSTFQAALQVFHPARNLISDNRRLWQQSPEIALLEYLSEFYPILRMAQT